MLTIDDRRLMGDLRELATFGRVGAGVSRVAFSPEDSAAREWLLGRMRSAGLQADIDGVGNVYGRSVRASRAILIGSHTDTVPDGGWLDGSLGVVYGLEIARRWREAHPDGTVGVDVISFQDEEGTYLSCLGSRSFCGGVGDAEIEAARSQGGRALAEALREAKYRGRPTARLDADRYRAYLEGHIEQGPRLETERRRIGIVTGIVGLRRYQLTFVGQADHAGTTPMPMRKDAGEALFALAHELLTRFKDAAGPRSVWNLGNVVFRPGAANVVPSETQLSVEFRDTDFEILTKFERIVLDGVDAVNGRFATRCTARMTLKIEPVAMDKDLGDAVEAAARRHGAPLMRLPSGAGHDAMIMARHLPAAMLFVPSIGGRSHSVAEDTTEADIVLGANVLMSVAEALLVP